MIKRIIIEGADQQGKTTLCNRLYDALGWDIIHFGKPHESFNFIDDYIIPEHSISDRNFLSEVVYSMVMIRKSRAQFALLSNIMKAKDTLLIVLDREDDFKFDSERHEEYSFADILQAMVIYRRVFDACNMEKIKLNPNATDYETRVQQLIQELHEDI